MTPAERLVATRRWVSIILAAARQPNEAGDLLKPIGSEGTTWVALEFAARLPGRIISTNGEYDEVTQKVFWDLYSEAPAAKAVLTGLAPAA